MWIQRHSAALGPIMFISLTLLASACSGADERRLAGIELPAGFEIDMFAPSVPGARSMTLGNEGTVFVGSRSAGNVYALQDRDGDGRSDAQWRLIDGAGKSPNGVAFIDGDLYVAFIDRIVRLAGIESRLGEPPQPEPVAELPDYGHHGWRYLAAGPEGSLYVALGAPCNVCEDYGQIRRVDPTTGEQTIIARGVRNSVGFDWHPRSGALWFTDNGRDLLGDNRPPDELNRLTTTGQHFGFPYCHGGDLPDPDYGAPGVCADYVPPVQKLGPHVAALGMRFYDGNAFPERYRGHIYIAEHGSWNRSERIGYRVMRVDPQAALAGEDDAYTPFASGWLLDNGDIWGRPVDVQVMPDGALLVSDDYRGAIYRISATP